MENKARVIRGRVEMIVPTGEREMSYVSPAFGPNNYQQVGQAILKQGLQVPTGDYTAPLVHAAYCVPEISNEPEFAEVRDKITNRWLWVFNRNIWTPSGVYVMQDTKALGRSAEFNLTELEDMLSGGTQELKVKFSKDRTVRFAPKSSYSLGVCNPNDLATNGFVVANYGVKGAEQLAQVATRFSNKPKTFGLNISEGKSPEQRVACLDSGWYVDDGRLVVDGDYSFGSYGYGYAFGVSPVSEADARKISEQ